MPKFEGGDSNQRLMITLSMVSELEIYLMGLGPISLKLKSPKVIKKIQKHF